MLLGTAANAAPGDHLRAGDAVITPDLKLGFQYRSNAFRAESNPQGTGALQIVPGVAVTLDTPQISFGLDARYQLNKFLFLGNPEGFSTDQISAQIGNLDRFNAFNVGADLNVLKDRQVSLRLGDNVLMQNNPNDSIPESDDPYASQFRNSLQGGIIGRPGPALSIDVGGKWQYSQFFVPTAEVQREPLNTRNSYGPTLDLKYSFLPRTAFVVDGSFFWNSWKDPDPTIGTLEFPTPNSRHLQFRTGVQGRISERFRVVAKVGYGTAWYDDGNNLSALGGLLVALQGDYNVTQQHVITLGYRKNFVDSFFTNTATHNSIYGRWKGQYGDRVTSSLDYALRFEGYNGAIERQDIVNQLRAGVDIKASDWLFTNVGAGWLSRMSTDDLVEYSDVSANLGVTFTY
ncbi:MAG: outer membrane beta-barrel protein [Myxococcota bacterium]